jgi:hypothetical protein
MDDRATLTIMDYYRRDGVKDLVPMKARGLFAKALYLENIAGETTPEAEELLELAIEAAGDINAHLR